MSSSKKAILDREELVNSGSDDDDDDDHQSTSVQALDTSCCPEEMPRKRHFHFLSRVLSAGLFVTLFTAAVFYWQTHPGVCLTETCINVASAVMSALDRSVDPCQDFYTFACGSWMKNNPLADGKSNWNPFNTRWQHNMLVMKQLLENTTMSGLSQAEEKAQRYYQACMNETKIKKLGAKPLQRLITQLGGWDLTGPWDKDNFQKVLRTVSARQLAFPFFTLLVYPDFKSSRNNIFVAQSSLGLSQKFYLNKTAYGNHLTVYQNFLVRLGVHLGGSVKTSQKIMKEILDFETELANITVPLKGRKNKKPVYHKMEVKDLKSLAPAIDWIPYLNEVFAPVPINESEPVIVYAKEYLQNVSDLITNTNKSILNNYMIMKVIRNMIPNLDWRFRDTEQRFQQVMYGIKSCTPRWKLCVSDTDSSLGFALGAMFVKATFAGDSKDIAEDMVSNIKRAFEDSLEHVSWMDGDTKKAVKEKADAIYDMMGYPEFIMNDTKLDKVYNDFKVKSDLYFQNVMQSYNFSARVIANLLRQAPTIFHTTPPEVEAYYDRIGNGIVLQAGILQTPFYNHHWPKFLNFGGIGVIIGHELIHAFGKKAREFDTNGNLRSAWKNSSVEAYKNQTQCMVEQYGNYSINQETLNGSHTLEENIADNGGLKAAYEAYVNWIERNGEEPTLPALGMTNHQLFFVGFAQMWCTVNQYHYNVKDLHSPPRFRVIGSVSNSHEFSKHFGCKENTPMNPKHKCNLW
ncbi:endothelin-converting enzyme 1-like [Syngnathus acus]|uniref:endothelin-converting enzyme 1-like n=1 Tax=Syngnathus acus TaxID=161584 RepID=UPI0018860CB1|nr:endothelin-converting enzyme 1-like [Syngnathus acus]